MTASGARKSRFPTRHVDSFSISFCLVPDPRIIQQSLDSDISSSDRIFFPSFFFSSTSLFFFYHLVLISILSSFLFSFLFHYCGFYTELCVNIFSTLQPASIAIYLYFFPVERKMIVVEDLSVFSVDAGFGHHD